MPNNKMRISRWFTEKRVLCLFVMCSFLREIHIAIYKNTIFIDAVMANRTILRAIKILEEHAYTRKTIDNMCKLCHASLHLIK